jgi:DNA-binding transcriptional LysR family regulator
MGFDEFIRYISSLRHHMDRRQPFNYLPGNNRLDVRLFERSTRAMRLTAEGQTLLDYASRAFDLLAEGEAQVTEDRAALAGTLRVAAPSAATEPQTTPHLRGCGRRRVPALC